MMHLLLGPPGDWSQCTIACGQPEGQDATWDRALFTRMARQGRACPTCLSLSHDPQPAGTCGVSEKQWMQQVLTLARQRGYVAYHPFRSQKSAPGWPDLALAKAGSPLYLVECKTNLGALSGHQRHWLATLRQTTGLVVAVWRPADWPTILEVLR